MLIRCFLNVFESFWATSLQKVWSCRKLIACGSWGVFPRKEVVFESSFCFPVWFERHCRDSGLGRSQNDKTQPLYDQQQHQHSWKERMDMFCKTNGNSCLESAFPRACQQKGDPRRTQPRTPSSWSWWSDFEISKGVFEDMRKKKQNIDLWILKTRQFWEAVCGLFLKSENGESLDCFF